MWAQIGAKKDHGLAYTCFSSTFLGQKGKIPSTKFSRKLFSFYNILESENFVLVAFLIVYIDF